MKKIILLLLLTPYILLSQGKIVKGLVVDNTNQPMPGATVQIKGSTSLGAITDFDGNFSILLDSKDAKVLVVSFIGFLSEEVDIANQNFVSVTLSPDVSELDEVVVVGYGTQRKSDLTGAISSVRVEETIALHVKSAIAGVKSKITFRFYFLLVVFVFFLVLNYFNIYLLDFRSNKNFILNTPITDLFFVSDIVLISFLSQLFYVFYIFYLIKSNFIKTNKKVLKMPYLNWVLLYTFIWLIFIVLINYYYFSSSLLLNNQQFNVYLKILSAVSIVIFILNPRILSYLPLISKINVYNVDTHSNEINKKIDFIITTQKLYLNPDFSLTELVFISQFSNSQIRNAIMANHSMNFRSYLNKFRVLYSEHLIKSNYLNTHSIVALGKESGFNSHQSFFRAFKKLHNMTPGQFRKKYFDNDSS